MCHRILVRCHEIKKIDNCRIKLREEIIVLQLITEVVFITFYFFTINCHMLWTSCFLNILFSFREREEKGEKYHVREKEWPLISYLSRPSPRPPVGVPSRQACVLPGIERAALHLAGWHPAKWATLVKAVFNLFFSKCHPGH